MMMMIRRPYFDVRRFFFLTKPFFRLIFFTALLSSLLTERSNDVGTI